MRRVGNLRGSLGATLLAMSLGESGALDGRSYTLNRPHWGGGGEPDEPTEPKPIREYNIIPKPQTEADARALSAAADKRERKRLRRMALMSDKRHVEIEGFNLSNVDSEPVLCTGCWDESEHHTEAATQT